LFPGYRLTAHGQSQISDDGLLGDGKRKTIAGGVHIELPDDVSATWSAFLFLYDPAAGSAVAGPSERETGRRSIDRVRLEVPFHAAADALNRPARAGEAYKSRC
jgi:hypothetical protein